MGYLKITKGLAATTAGEILVPADNVATVKRLNTGNIQIKYLGGFETLLDFEGSATQKSVDELVKALDLANGTSGPAIDVTLTEEIDLIGTTVSPWS